MFSALLKTKIQTGGGGGSDVDEILRNVKSLFDVN